MTQPPIVPAAAAETEVDAAEDQLVPKPNSIVAVNTPQMAVVEEIQELGQKRTSDHTSPEKKRVKKN